MIEDLSPDPVEWLDALHAAATAATGLHDFGEPAYRTGLIRFLAALDTSRFGPRTPAVLSSWLVGHLSARLKTEFGWSQHPEALSAPLPQPVAVIGLPRSGTTMLHKLLAMDPAFQGLESWLASNPMPRPPRESWAARPEFQAVSAEREASYRAFPALRRAHEVLAQEVDECIAPLAQQFVSNLFGTCYPAPDYDRWYRDQDEISSYRRYADILRLIGLNDPGRRWLLKNPGHTLGIDAFLATFPKAHVIQTHREPSEIIPSVCALMTIVQESEGLKIDRPGLARRELAVWVLAAQRSLAAQQRDPDRFTNVDYRALLAEPIKVIRTIYADLNRDLEPAVEAAMQDWLAVNRQNRHGVHRYSLGEFALDRDEIDALFAPYRERFGMSVHAARGETV